MISDLVLQLLKLICAILIIGTPGVYDISKSDGGDTETIRMSELDHNTLKKVAACDVGNGGGGGAGGGHDSGYYPSPYAMTQFTGDGRDGGGQCGIHLMEAMHHTSPMKAMPSDSREAREGEPLYATVKRTPRATRSELHVYQYPSK